MIAVRGLVLISILGIRLLHLIGTLLVIRIIITVIRVSLLVVVVRGLGSSLVIITLDSCS
jgi:hypothetical protein